MSKKATALDNWKTLYTLAKQVKKLAPWEWMEEDEVFGVKHPDTGDLLFVSVMGMAEEHTAVSLYMGAQALYDFHDFREDAMMMDPMEMGVGTEKLLQIRQLMLSYEDREMLEKEDRAKIKAVGTKFRGRGEWPLFRSYEIGLLPWFLTDDEVALMIPVLEQLLEVAPRLDDDPILFEQEDEHYLVRVAKKEGDTLTWEDEIMHIEPPVVEEIPVQINDILVETYKKLPQNSQLVIEADFFMSLTPVAEKERPVFPFQLLFVDANSGEVLTFELVELKTTYKDMVSGIAMTTLEKLTEIGVRPAALHIRDADFYQVMEPLADRIGVAVKIKRELPWLDEARMGMQSMMMGGGMPMELDLEALLSVLPPDIDPNDPEFKAILNELKNMLK